MNFCAFYYIEKIKHNTYRLKNTSNNTLFVTFSVDLMKEVSDILLSFKMKQINTVNSNKSRNALLK
jgi:hypothetical protein